MLSKEETKLMIEWQEYCRSLLPDVNATLDDVYPIFAKLGEKNMIQRMQPWKDVAGSTRLQMLLNMCVGFMSPEVDMAMTASGILVGNALYHNPKKTDMQIKALEEIYKGTKIGGIGITEMEHGSDAVNMQTIAKINDDQSINYNGTKIYTTNGAVADYFATYGVTDVTDPRHTMMLTLFKREDTGLSTERLAIPAARGVGIAKVNYNNVTVSADRMIAPPGEGYKRLFRGLTPERIAIIGSSLSGIWNSLSHGVIFAQLRAQFGKTIFNYQGISHVLADLYSRAAAYTAFGFQVADFYDKHVAEKIHHGEKPSAMDEGTVAIMAAQGKYLTARMGHETAYEVVQTMGGRGSLSEDGSNSLISRGENLSRISEVVGGHRNVQLMIVEAGLRATTAMSIAQYTDKVEKGLKKENAKMTELILQKAEKMLVGPDADKMGEAKDSLKNVVEKLKAAVAGNNKIEMEAYGKALGKAVGAAGKAIYKATKGVDEKDD
jgi:alkylation response protein AidB-like acyl-CoA dehydrogenase